MSKKISSNFGSMEHWINGTLDPEIWNQAWNDSISGISSPTKKFDPSFSIEIWWLGDWNKNFDEIQKLTLLQISKNQKTQKLL